MAGKSQNDVTLLLLGWCQSNGSAIERLMPLVDEVWLLRELKAGEPG